MNHHAVYDVKGFHFGIEEIQRYSCHGAPEDELETPAMQALALRFLKRGVHPSCSLSPVGWCPRTGNTDRLSTLCAMADYAYAQVPMYRELYRQVGYEPGAIGSFADFEALPVLTRDTLNSWRDDDRLSMGRNACDTYFVGTSGSSGRSLRVYYDQNTAIIETLESLQQYAFYLREDLPPARWIYNIHMSRGWLSSLEGKYRTFTLNEIPPLSALAKHFEKLTPIILCAPPSHLWTLAPLGDLRRYGIRVISTNSEQSSRIERNSLSRIFGVPVLDEYSSVELGVIAYESPTGSYAVNEQGLHLELLDVDSSGFGRVVATDLRSWVMPLIRYDQGDLARWDAPPGECSCLGGRACFKEIRGRADDYFLRADGRKVPSATLLNMIDTLFTAPDATLREYRLIQQSTDRIRFEFVVQPGEELPFPSRRTLAQSLKSHFEPGLNIDFIQLERLSQTPSYKRKKVVRAFV